MRTLKLTLEYDGSAYVGWQMQRHGASVQGLLQQAIRKMTHEATNVVGASRTDAGVHALGQVASFRTRSRIAAESFLRGLPSLLPRDIVVKKSGRSGQLIPRDRGRQGKDVSLPDPQ